MPSILKPDSTILTLGLAAVLAVGVSLLATYVPRDGTSMSAIIEQPGQSQHDGGGGKARKDLASIGTGSGQAERRGSAGDGGIGRCHHGSSCQVPTIMFVSATRWPNSRRKRLLARLSAARAEVDVRIAERDEEKETDEALLAWRKALDDLSDAERSLHDARVKYDKFYIAGRKGNASTSEIDTARRAIDAAKLSIERLRNSVEKAAANEDLPPPTRLDSGLEIARSDLKLAEIAYDRTTVRATADGKVLQFDARVGETVAPGSSMPVAIIGDLSSLKVTAEVEERDIGKIQLDQTAVVRSNAFSGEDFTGKVTRIASRVATPGLGSARHQPAARRRGSRGRDFARRCAAAAAGHARRRLFQGQGRNQGGGQTLGRVTFAALRVTKSHPRPAS